MPSSPAYAGSLLLPCIECVRQQVEEWLQFATDPYDLERFYPITEEGAKQLIEDVITTAPTPLSCCPSFSSLGSDINSIHKEDNALVDLLGVTEIPVELGLVFLLPEIQWLYQAHQVAWREVLSHSSTHRVGFALGMNGREWGNRYRTPMLYPRHCTRQRKVYVADERKQRYEDDYDPDLDCYYYLYLCACSYLWNLHSYPY